MPQFDPSRVQSVAERIGTAPLGRNTLLCPINPGFGGPSIGV
jgi:hypothetical protein